MVELRGNSGLFTVIIRKQPTPEGKRANRNGYLLPAVIALSLAIVTISISALSVVSQNSQTLNSQYYTQLATEASQSGVAAAIKCIEAGSTDWDQSNGKPKLAPQTDCNGATVSGKPTLVSDNGNVQSTYTVDGLQNPYSNTTRVINSTGKVTVKSSSGTVVQTITKVKRAFGQVSPVLGNVSQVSTGGNSTCAIALSKAYCWGSNATGQLGAGAIANQSLPAAVDTSVMTGTVTKVSVGLTHTCAVASGKAYCWGQNANGELGNRSNSDSNVPVAVDARDAWTDTYVTGGGYCAWALWPFGPCGYWVPVTYGYVYNPASSLYNKTVIDIQAGAYFTCALASDGTVSCWGYGGNGRLGNGSNSDQNIPTGVYQAAAHPYTYIQSSCLWSIIIWCVFPWPPPYAANGGTIPDSPLYNKRVTGLGRPKGGTMCVTAVDITDTTTQGAGYPYCWGQNIAPPLGNNYSQHANCGANGPPWPFTMGGTQSADESDTNQPAALPGNIWVSSQKANMVVNNHLNTINASGTYYYWGWGGRRTTVNAYATDYCISVIFFIPWFFAGFNYDTYFSLLGEGNNTPFGSTVIANFAGTEDALACYYTAGAPYCDAHGTVVSHGETGSGTVTAGTSSGWQQVKLDGVASLGFNLPITDIDTGNNHVCAIASGKVFCWGLNTSGQVGNGTFTNALEPVLVRPSSSLLGTAAATTSTFDNVILF